MKKTADLNFLLPFAPPPLSLVTELGPSVTAIDLGKCWCYRCVNEIYRIALAAAAVSGRSVKSVAVGPLFLFFFDSLTKILIDLSGFSQRHRRPADCGKPPAPSSPSAPVDPNPLFLLLNYANFIADVNSKGFIGLYSSRVRWSDKSVNAFFFCR